MKPYFSKKIRIRFRDADPAGILFFGKLPEISHDVFEDLLEHLGIPFAEWFLQKNYLIPVRRLEVDYLRPFLPGKTYTATAFVSHVGSSSFTVTVKFTNEGGETHAQVNLVQVFVESSTQQKTAIPTQFLSKLNEHLSQP
jgi:acyl-CoA thioesterase FadM